MYLDRIAGAGPDTDLIAPNGRSALLWEAELIRARNPGAARPSPNIFGFTQWLTSAWEQAQTVSPALRERSLLSAPQAQRLWQQVIDATDAGRELISSAGVAGWCRHASRLLHAFGAPPDSTGASVWSGDSAVFPGWHRQYQRELDRNGWVDPDHLLYLLNRTRELPCQQHLMLLDPPAGTPETERLIGRYRDQARRVDCLSPEHCSASVETRLVETPADELVQAVTWAARKFDASRDCRLAIVVSEPAQRRDEIESALGSLNVPVTFPSGRSIGSIGIFGAAMAALAMLMPGAGFEAFSRFLRSPFFGNQDTRYRLQAARFERQLRSDPRSQHDFAASYLRYGLREEFRKHLPQVAARLDQVFERLPRQATPTSWSQTWQNCLRILEWDGLVTDPGARLSNAWDDAWGRFSALTPITGALSAGAAWQEFQAVVHAATIFETVHLSGLHVLASIDELGPGFSGAWICGFSDRAWPARERSNPLLPGALRSRLGMPGSDASTDLAAAGAELERLFARVPEIVFSCPQRILDQPQVPNPRFADWVETATESVARPPTDPVFEQVDDPAPPLERAGIPGGVRTLELQSACPVRAFAEARLGAQALERPVRGIGPRLRGIALHRALERLFAFAPASERERHVQRSVSDAFADAIPAGGEHWQAQVAAEQARAMTLLEQLLELDLVRPPFTVVANEKRAEIRLAGRQLRCRIDRIDALADGQQILLDYKTGRATISDWFRDRPGNVQLPLYTLAVSPPVAAIAVIALGDKKLEYIGAGTVADALPGRQQAFERGAWEAQLQRWQQQFEALAGEFTAGDVRIRSDAADLADGQFAALTRIREIVT